MEPEGLGPPSPFELFPQELKETPQWVNWRYQEERKVPVNPKTLGNAGVGWPNTWTSYEKALENFELGGVGLGFVLTESDPYVCADLDKCVDAHGEVSLAACGAVLDTLQGYVELSPSGNGLHVWVKSEQPVGNWKTKGIEIYSSARWMTVTGRADSTDIREIPERTDALKKVLASYFGRNAPPRVVVPEVAEVPHDDGALWEKLFGARRGDFFRSLYVGDISVCYNDHSRAVIMLANQLALMTDGDPARMKRLLLQTGLVNDKWFTRRGTETWLDYQIRDAIRYTAMRRR